MNLQLQEVSCQKSVSGADFSAGLQDYRFSVGRPYTWIPKKSFFRFKVKLTVGGAQPNYNTDQIALAENCCSNLYTNCYVRAGGQDISALTSFLPQASQVRNRLSKTYGELKSTLGQSFMLEPSFTERSKMVSSGPFGNAVGSKDTFRPGTTASTVELQANGVVVGINTTFLTADVGDWLVLDNYPYLITTVTDATNIVVNNGQIDPRVTAASTGWYMTTSQGEDPAEEANSVYVLWQPPVGAFDIEKNMPAGDYKISLMPEVSYKERMVETLTAMTQGTTAGLFDIEIQDVKLYVCTVTAEVPQGPQSLWLMETEIHSKSLQSSSDSYQFTVPPSTKAISVFFQAGSTGTDTRFPPSSFTLEESYERTMSSVQITYANVVKPNSRWEALYATGTTTNQLQQRYIDTYREAGMLGNPAGTFSFSEWLQQGVLIHYSFNRDSSSQDTILQLQTTMGGAVPANSKVFICAHYTRKVEISSDNGLITSVRALTI